MLAEGFKYRGLIKYFEEISAIPRATFSEQRIAEYICDFAKRRGLFFFSDAHNNVFVRLPASEGREGEDAILLQGHTDMVCEKNADSTHDFEVDGIELCEVDGWIRANGTTLGADNGVAVAIMLYILDGADGTLTSHPTIECLFTAAEEKGLVGAASFDYSVVTATSMINMDSADEREIIVGCAGGQRSELCYKPKCEPIDKTSFNVLEISVKGLFGGHSGEDINKNRANANKLMARILNSLYQKHPFRLVSLYGGSKDNAIPRECEAVIATESADEFLCEIAELKLEIAKELSVADAKFDVICATPSAEHKLMLCAEDTKKTLLLLSTVRDGVLAMNTDIPDVVEFSRNLGIVSLSAERGEGCFVFMARSSRDSHIRASNEELDTYADFLNIEHIRSNSYPAWESVSNSRMAERYAKCYEALFGEPCKVNVIHAGLECAIIKKRCPELDIISCGALVLDLHSPDEALNIASFERFFAVIKAVIESK